MPESLAIQCPHCGEQFALAFDLSEGDSEFIIDCEICCRPVNVVVRTSDGNVSDLQVSPA